MLDFNRVREHFKRLNDDAEAEGCFDEVIPFSDVDYYTDAIQTEFEEENVSDFDARDLALRLAAI